MRCWIQDFSSGSAMCMNSTPIRAAVGAASGPPIIWRGRRRVRCRARRPDRCGRSMSASVEAVGLGVEFGMVGRCLAMPSGSSVGGEVAAHAIGCGSAVRTRIEFCSCWRGSRRPMRDCVRPHRGGSLLRLRLDRSRAPVAVERRDEVAVLVSPGSAQLWAFGRLAGVAQLRHRGRRLQRNAASFQAPRKGRPRIGRRAVRCRPHWRRRGTPCPAWRRCPFPPPGQSSPRSSCFSSCCAEVGAPALAPIGCTQMLLFGVRLNRKGSRHSARETVIGYQPVSYGE